MPVNRSVSLSEPHPALGVLRQRRITNTAVAEALDISPGWVGSCLLRRVPAPAVFRERLAVLLGLPVHELFYDDPPAPRHPGNVLILDADEEQE